MPAETAPGPASRWQNWRLNARHVGAQCIAPTWDADAPEGGRNALRPYIASLRIKIDSPLAYFIRDQSLAKGENRCLRAITNTQFLKDNREVVFHRLLRIDQLLRDLFVAHAGCDI